GLNPAREEHKAAMRSQDLTQYGHPTLLHGDRFAVSAKTMQVRGHAHGRAPATQVMLIAQLPPIVVQHALVDRERSRVVAQQTEINGKVIPHCELIDLPEPRYHPEPV